MFFIILFIGMQELMKRVEKLEIRVTDLEKPKLSTIAPPEVCVKKEVKAAENDDDDDVDLFGSDSEASGKLEM